MSPVPSRRLLPAALAACVMGLAGLAQAQGSPSRSPTVIHDTAGPWGWLGVWGADLYTQQRTAARFTVPADGDLRLVQVSLWLMNNSIYLQLPVRVTLETDALDEGGADSAPSGQVLATWSHKVLALGWDPVQQAFSSNHRPLLAAGRSYWVVAQSNAPVTQNPVWNYASEGTAWGCVSHPDLTWQTCGEGAAPTLKVEALPVLR